MQIQPNNNVIGVTPAGSAGVTGSTVQVKNPLPADNATGQVRTSGTNTAQQGKPSTEEVNGATEKLQKFVETVRSDIQFSVDDESGRNIVKVVDKQTKDVLMQFPSEEALAISKSLDKFQGLFVKQQA